MRYARSLPFGGFALAAVLAHGPANAIAQQSITPPADWQAKVDAVFAEFTRGESPGCAVALYHNGRIVLERGYGYADLENDIRITPQSVFYVGSLSKQFTAFAAALAIQSDKLKLDDDIRKYLPELRDYGSPITVRHLIHHTSGVRDINTLLGIAGRRGDEAFDNLEVLRVVARQKALNFKPGDDHLYSNSGYALLALVVERSTGTPFGKFAEDQIFKPLGMTASHFHDDQTRMVKHRADAYQRTGGGEIRLNTPVNERAGAGGVFANVRDLLHWDENYYTGRVGGSKVIEEVQTPGKLNDGTALTYAWGLTVGAYRGLRTVDHGGSLGGYRAHLIRFPEQHFSVACLCNMASITPNTLVRQVADVYLGSALAPVVAGAGRGGRGNAAGGGGGRGTPAGAALTAEQLRAFAGSYYSDELDATYTVLVTDGQLALRRGTGNPTPLVANGPEEFRFGATMLRFVRGSGGRVEALAVDAGRVLDIRFVRQ